MATGPNRPFRELAVDSLHYKEGLSHAGKISSIWTKEGFQLMTAPELTDGVVILRMMTLADAEVHLANEDEVTVRFFGGRSTIETSRAAIEEARLSWESGGAWLNLGIWEVATGELVGYVDANLVCPGYRPGVAANITYNVRPAVRGRGYVSRAVGLMVRHLSEKTSAKAAVIQFNPENQASARIAQKAGFEHLCERIHEDGNRMMVYGLQLRPGAKELLLSDVYLQVQNRVDLSLQWKEIQLNSIYSKDFASLWLFAYAKRMESLSGTDKY
jgi:RimJ/RimL family protein N-acetyltransferase